MNITELRQGDPYPMDLLLLADPSEELVLEYVQRGRCYTATAADGAVIGVYVLLPTRPGTVELVNVAVREDCHGRGYGKRLVLHAVGQARESGFKTIEIGTGSTGVAQLALYQKCGFRITGIDKDFFVRHYAEEIYENGMQVIDMIRMSQDL